VQAEEPEVSVARIVELENAEQGSIGHQFAEQLQSFQPQLGRGRLHEAIPRSNCADREG
jgi:hypothetical protein